MIFEWANSMEAVDRRVEQRKELGIDLSKVDQKLFEQMTEKQKTSLYLKFGLGLSFHEIARIMRVNYSTVRRHVNAAIRELNYAVARRESCGQEPISR